MQRIRSHYAGGSPARPQPQLEEVGVAVDNAGAAARGEAVGRIQVSKMHAYIQFGRKGGDNDLEVR